jgi:hypothetical protein
LGKGLRALGLVGGLVPALGLALALAPGVAPVRPARPSLYVLAVGADDYRDEHRLN